MSQQHSNNHLVEDSVIHPQVIVVAIVYVLLLYGQLRVAVRLANVEVNNIPESIWSNSATVFGNSLQ